jgi:hypothetical protein
MAANDVILANEKLAGVREWFNGTPISIVISFGSSFSVPRRLFFAPFDGVHLSNFCKDRYVLS